MTDGWTDRQNCRNAYRESMRRAGKTKRDQSKSAWRTPVHVVIAARRCMLDIGCRVSSSVIRDTRCVTLDGTYQRRLLIKLQVSSWTINFLCTSQAKIVRTSTFNLNWSRSFFRYFYSKAYNCAKPYRLLYVTALCNSICRICIKTQNMG